MQCPSDELISLCAEKALADEDEARVLGHADACAPCREVLAGLVAAVAEERLGRLETLRSPLEPLPTTAGDLPLSGTRVGRYEILERLGAGGMGVVYRARDAELERNVAIKLVRERSEGATARLRLEARALAKLEHPNVVSVHDAGSWHGYAFIVMQLFGGIDLRAWLALSNREPAEVLTIAFDIAKGLHAAHQFGVIHRDIKPENIFIADDGHAAVGDFGLAVDEKATAEGGPAGTPVYMAPEVLAGDDATAGSDQFSLAVALFEAFSSQRPFAGATLTELRESTLKGPPTLPGSVPRRARAAVEKALAAKPEERHVSVEAFADALRPRSKRPLLAAAAVMTIALAGGSLVVASGGKSDPCTAAGDSVGEIWNEPIETKLLAVVAGSDKPHHREVGQKTTEQIGRYAGALRRGYNEACVANHRGIESSDLLDRRTVCLNERRNHIAAIVSTLADGKPQAFDRAPVAISNLPSATDCANTQLLLERLPLPGDPETRAEIAALRGRVSAIDAALALGDEPRALSLVGDDAAGDAKKAPHPSARAGFLLAAAETFQRNGKLELAEKLANAATLAAAEARDDEQLARAWLGLAGIVGYKMEQPKRGLELLATAKIAVARAGAPPMLSAHLVNLEGILRELVGEPEAALALFREAARLAEEAAGPDHPRVATALDNVAGLERVLGRFEKALEVEMRVLALRTKVLGPDHPDLGRTEESISRSYLELGRLDEAEDLARSALARIEASLGDSHPSVAIALNHLSSVLVSRGKLEEAEKHDRRTVAITTSIFGREHPRAIRALADLGTVLAAREKFEEALAAKTEALELGRKAFGPEHRVVGQFENNVAIALADAGKLEEAIEGFHRAIKIKSASLGADSAAVGFSRTNLAEVLCEAKRYDEGIVELDAAIAAAEARGHATTPDTNWARTTRGGCWLHKGRGDRALRDIDRVLATEASGIDPMEWGSHFELRMKALAATRAKRADIEEAGHNAIRQSIGGDGGAKAVSEVRGWLSKRGLQPQP